MGIGPTDNHDDIRASSRRNSVSSQLAPELERLESSLRDKSEVATIVDWDSNDRESISSPSKEKDAIYVEFKENDPRNPFHFSPLKKWTITITICAYTGMTAACAATFATGAPSMIRDLGCSDLAAAAGVGIYPFGFGLAPLFLASFSEEFGRTPIYLISITIFWLCFLATALSKNIAMVLFFRFLSGAAGSTGSTMVGGSLADIWATSERGLPMSIFGLAAIMSTGLGPVIAGWIEANPKLEWRWIQWLHFITTGVLVLLMMVVLKETRGSVILAKEARRLRKQTGDERYQPLVKPPNLKQLIWMSATRPLYLLFTESVVASFSLWVGFAWGVLYGLIQSVGPVFKTVYGFGPGESGSVFATLCIGAIIGTLLNSYQERLYQRYVKVKGPEARLFAAMVAGILLPIGCFIYAWTCNREIHWIAPCIGIIIIILGIYTIYAAVFNYLADCYLTYASSALAGQSLCRNMAGAAFPMFTNQMYNRLTYKWASSLFGFIAAALAVIPFVLFFWGPKIRARSRFARKMAALEEARTL
ncbi:hypothetical protein FRC02_000644 [Tulasnella sp. 418]|nr:hypothetical protein FRC02_000644 [Tulasnella sp. 418]